MSLLLPSDPPVAEPSDSEVPGGLSTALPGPAIPRRTRPPRIRGARVALVLTLVMAGSALFVSGYSLGHLQAGTPGTAAADEAAFQAFWDAYHAITQDFVGTPVDQRTLVEGALSGMFATLKDPYSQYLAPTDLTSTLSSLSGQFSGIGAVMNARAPDGTEGCTPLGPTCALVVLRTIPGAPAESAGLLANDVIVAVGGQVVAGQTIDTVTNEVRGPQDTTVVLRLVRDGGAPFDMSITRQVVVEPEVDSRLVAGGQVGYIHLAQFSPTSPAEFKQQLQALLAQGVTHIAFDLRGDPGGFVDAAQSIASQFLASGPAFWEQFADGHQVAQLAQSGGVATDRKIQLVVLVDKGSASASEIVAGALQDTGRGKLVGQTTFGKGIIQEFQTMTDDMGGFRLTIAKWLTPVTKTWINGKGLTPDIVVTPPTNPPAGDDPGLDAAVKALLGSAAPSSLAGADRLG
ncbi:MAG: S41 family peptidase [Candidatus Limnocylindrales bacterium]